MRVNKNRIKTSFSKSIHSYEKEILVQKKAALKLCEFSRDFEGFGLDLGCGTGILSSLLNKNIVGLDISFNMAKIYKTKNEKVVVGDIENIPFKSKTFDFAVSNFALHWVDVEKGFKEISRVLKEEGKFAFSMPVEGSFKIVQDILGEKNFDFLDKDYVLDILSKNFTIKKHETVSYNLEFQNGLELLKHLHSTGSSVGKTGSTIGEKIKIFQKFKNYNKPAVLNFEVMFVYAINHRF
ncbi:MAG: methyltransferase domain-containing protein [Sulfurihydrogenibium sp.]